VIDIFTNLLQAAPLVLVAVAENVWVPVSPKKEEPAAAVVAEIVTEPRPVVEVVNQVFPSAMVSEVGGS
jgi:hypothetical protein